MMNHPPCTSSKACCSNNRRGPEWSLTRSMAGEAGHMQHATGQSSKGW